MAIIKANNPNLNEQVAGVDFVDGYGETADAWAIEYFKRHGYDVDDVLPDTLTWSAEADPTKMNKADLVEYADAEGIDISGASTKAQILDLVVLPGAPTDVAGTVADSQSSVSWTAPDFTGAGAISGYEVVGYDAEGTEVGRHADTASPFVFEGLTNGESYTFAVRAENAYGFGALSAPSDEVVPDAG